MSENINQNFPTVEDPRIRTAPSLRITCTTLSIALALLLAPRAMALDFQITFTTSTYQVVLPGDDYASLLTQFESEPVINTLTLQALEDISAPVYASGVNGDYGILMTTTIEPLQTGVYTFQVGTDWGRGGASIIKDIDTDTILDEYVTDQDLWWNNDWGNSSVFTTSATLTAGSTYEIGWLGFEGCCGGVATIRFSFDGGSFQVFDSPNGDPLMISNPEPGTGILLGLGLALLPRRRRRQL